VSVPRLSLIAALVAVCGMAQSVRANCRQALALGLDVSSSVDSQEYALQLGGLAGALLDKDVQAVLLAQPSAPVALAIFDWSGRFNQNLITDWRLIQSPQDLQDVAATLKGRLPATGARPTALGAALTYGANLLARAPVCWQQTLDISGDGKSNDGHRPKAAKTHPVYATAVINGLVIGADVTGGDQIADNDVSELSSYYRDEVIHGAGAFVQTAVGYNDYAQSMREKLLRELNMAVSGASQNDRRGDG